MPIFSYHCRSCGFEWDDIRPYDPDETTIECPHCETNTGDKVPTIPGGYSMDSGGASTKPRRAASKGSGKKLNLVRKDK